MGEEGPLAARVDSRFGPAGALMRRAVGMAAAAHPHPNPRVAAIVIGADGAEAGDGVHAGPGAAHAEIVALMAAGEAARGGTLVVTLEPCVHEGRTPPCTEAIIAAGIRHVVIGATDPDERVNGAGIARLRAAGIDVTTGVHAAEVEAMDPGYFKHRRTGLPSVTVKLATTLDGQAAAADGSSRWITGPEARTDAHRLRAAADAVVIGAGTLRADDPRLDVRIAGYAGSQPRPVIVAGTAPLPAHARIWERTPLVYAPGGGPTPGETVPMPGPALVAPRAMLRDLAERGMLAVLVEGGPRLAGTLIREGLADRLVVYLGALLGAGIGMPAVAGEFATIGDARKLHITGVRRLGGDVRIDCRFEEE